MRLFVYCSDPREAADLERKINQKLLKPGEKITRLTLYGGPIPFAHPRDLRAGAESFLEQIRFGMKMPGEFQIPEVVLVFHDCGFYANVPFSVTRQTKLHDVVRAIRFLRKHIHRIKIRAYYDSSVGDKISFIRYRARRLACAN